MRFDPPGKFSIPHLSEELTIRRLRNGDDNTDIVEEDGEGVDEGLIGGVGTLLAFQDYTHTDNGEIETCARDPVWLSVKRHWRG